MLKNYLKIAFRNLWKNKVYAFINVIGLAVAFGSALLLFLTAHFELSYDDFQLNKDRIFKAYYKINRPQKVEYGAAVQTPLRPALMNDFSSEIKYATRVMNSGTQIIKGDKTFSENLFYVDADFLKMFSFKMLKGNANTALNDLSNVVIKEKVAKAIFGDKDPIGQTLNMNFGGKIKGFIVAGVMEDAPENSSVENDILARFENNPEYEGTKNVWDSDYHNLYIQLADKVDYQAFELRLQPFTKKYFDKQITQLKHDGAVADERKEVMSLRLLPFKEQHFNKKIGRGAIDPSYPYILLVISILIVLIACINFINLSIARSLNRAKEVGMRKALGALQNQIVRQFWGEAFIICLTAFLLGCLLAYALMPEYNAIFRSHLSWRNLQNPLLVISLIISFLAITLLAGGYPAWLVARFNTVEVLKGKVKVSSRSGGIRNSLIIVQFAISVLLITCTLIVWNQINFLRNKPLGFSEANVVSIPVGSEVNGHKLLDFMRNKLADQPRILSLTGADINIGRGKDESGSKSVFGFEIKGKSYQTNGLGVDYDYLKTLHLQLIAGRDFSREFATDSSKACIINETMAKQLGMANPVGTRLPLGDSVGKTIIGVVKDYHFESLHQKIESITLFFNKDFGIRYIFAKISPQNSQETMTVLEKAYKEVASKSDFQGSFLDENTNNQYRKEERMSKIFISAAILAILLSCLGLFAIALMSMAQRTKEIGIRKVLGASTPGLVALLSKDFLKLVLVAIVIASPIAWYAMNQWLSDFAYHVDIQWWVFVIAGVLAVLIALLTVSYQAIRAALMNPVKSLKTE